MVRSKGTLGEKGVVQWKMGVPTPASKLRSKMSLIVQAEPRTINAATKNLNISVQKVVKSRLVWYAAMVKPQAMIGCESRTCK